jgi:hypothetical protein
VGFVRSPRRYVPDVDQATADASNPFEYSCNTLTAADAHCH